MRELTEEEKKALLHILDIAVKVVGLTDGGALIGNCQHFIRLMNDEKKE